MRILLATAFLSSALAGAVLCGAAIAQPAQVTATCKDGFTATAATRARICAGHGGVASPATAAAATTPSAESTPMPNPGAINAPAGSPAASPIAPARPARSSGAPLATQAPGGGPGLVWVNSNSKVYHCPSDRYYGRTRHGSYMAEAAAKAAGNHAEHNKSCS